MEKNMHYFLNRKCKLVLNNDFVLYGWPREITQAGVVFETDQKISFISFSKIREFFLDDGEKQHE